MLVLVHFGLAVVYMMVIANVIYRMRVISAIASGVGLSILLYALNYIVFTGLGMATERGDVRALSAHLVLGLLGSALYKAISVPPPMQEAQLR